MAVGGVYFCVESMYVPSPAENTQSPDIGRLIVEQNLKKYERYNDIIRKSPESRWKWFNDNYAGLANRVSVRHIATFLHMQRVTLSKIRSNLSKR